MISLDYFGRPNGGGNSDYARVLASQVIARRKCVAVVRARYLRAVLRNDSGLANRQDSATVNSDRIDLRVFSDHDYVEYATESVKETVPADGMKDGEKLVRAVLDTPYTRDTKASPS